MEAPLNVQTAVPILFDFTVATCVSSTLKRQPRHYLVVNVSFQLNERRLFMSRGKLVRF